ncbi:hypothetical protein AOL_s00083g86 [Orbilia oligospora ATCC 24927]|uniref:Terpene synthase n=1 Tax=Arthrobotrys oligospora (strain ATCC 24927 / CBS 115.81 / DSM 1491) TaxID=756982 RepID=G1XGF5_ARTOA|nr:hypothetical protein AOL_s00083g86 [Orbilia oligospora ATCC 24927]EGX47578.1 hypothetical protein AOL_s00083g86 [Orbilia oligospora ATCC 24927]
MVKKLVTSTDDQTWTNKDGLILLLGRPELEGEEKVIVKLPNFYKSILATPRKVNPLLENVKDTDLWVSEKLGLGKAFQKFAEIEIPLLCSAMLPNAPEQPLRALLEWMSWVIFFDDRYDRGDFEGKPIEAAQDILETLAILDDDHPPIPVEENALRHIYQCVWKRISANAPPDERARFKLANRDYMIGLLYQDKLMGKRNTILTPEEYMSFRRKTSGVRTVALFSEWAVNLNAKIPLYVMEHPSVKDFKELSDEIIALCNDIISSAKEIQGFTLQEAMDKAGEMVFQTYEKWEEALRELPTWDEEIDANVARLIQGYADACWGNLDWSYHTARYLGNDREMARATGFVSFYVKDVRKIQELAGIKK